jgi:glycine dehydrogenase subunit 2
MVGREGDRLPLADEAERPQSIGRLSAFMGNAGILLRAYVYMRLLGAEGMRRVSPTYATLNANYLLARLREAGFTVAYPERRASHEFIVTLKDVPAIPASTRWTSPRRCWTTASTRRPPTSRCWCRSAC